MVSDILRELSSIDLAWVSRLRRELVLFVVVMGVAFLFYRFPYAWTVEASSAASRRIQNVQAEIKSVQAEIEAAEALRRTVAETTENLKRIETRLNEMKERLPSDKHVSRILAEISDNDFKKGVHIITIKPGTPEDKGELVRLPFQITLESDYRSFGEYLLRIEGLKRVMLIDNFKIDKKEGPGPQISAEVILSAYVLNHRK